MTKRSDILLVTDMDGTLMMARHEFPKKNLEAIRRFVASGGKFAIATGRSIVSADYYIKNLPPIGPSIVFNGGGIYDFTTHAISNTSFLPVSATRYLRDMYDRFPQAGIEVYVGPDIYVPRLKKYTEIHLGNEFLQYIPQNSVEDLPENTFKIMFAADGEVMEEMLAYTSSIKDSLEGVYFIQTGPHYLEMLPADVTKGTAMPALAALYGVKLENVYAIGDYYNDLEMLSCVGHPVCPLDAKEEVKAICTMQVCPCLDGAVAELIEHIEAHY